MSKLVRLGLHVKRAERQNLTVPKVFKRSQKGKLSIFQFVNCHFVNLQIVIVLSNSRTVDRSPEKVMFHFQDEEWTFQQVEDYSNQVVSLLSHVFGSVSSFF